MVARIVAEAQRERVSLSEVERKMLYFSETGRTLPDIDKVNEAFERDYDHDEYEKKITNLIHNARVRARKEDKPENEAWSDAIRVLRKGDHYLLVMIDQIGSASRPPADLLKLWATGLLVVCLGVVLPAVFFTRFRIEPTGEAVVFFGWAIVTCAAVICVLLYVFLGRQRAEAVINRVTDILFGFFDQPK